ncbi:hypothetical protein BD310DRAFT_166776 [Dichomitus squalens]|uniref:Uncharacterized protein n=1 Tax=Dichomitus squalens TaxID=114155 RepID=A0A4Q9PHI2_9APHY|nr:hypothetical protein BD310DRAFT_166776 [Dichomitus squalens]
MDSCCQGALCLYVCKQSSVRNVSPEALELRVVQSALQGLAAVVGLEISSSSSRIRVCSATLSPLRSAASSLVSRGWPCCSLTREGDLVVGSSGRKVYSPIIVLSVFHSDVTFLLLPRSEKATSVSEMACSLSRYSRRPYRHIRRKILHLILRRSRSVAIAACELRQLLRARICYQGDPP